MSLHGNPLISEATLDLFSFVPAFEQVLNPCMQMGWGEGMQWCAGTTQCSLHSRTVLCPLETGALADHENSQWSQLCLKEPQVPSLKKMYRSGERGMEVTSALLFVIFAGENRNIKLFGSKMSSLNRLKVFFFFILVDASIHMLSQ